MRRLLAGLTLAAALASPAAAQAAKPSSGSGTTTLSPYWRGYGDCYHQSPSTDCSWTGDVTPEGAMTLSAHWAPFASVPAPDDELVGAGGNGYGGGYGAQYVQVARGATRLAVSTAFKVTEDVTVSGTAFGLGQAVIFIDLFPPGCTSFDCTVGAHKTIASNAANGEAPSSIPAGETVSADTAITNPAHGTWKVQLAVLTNASGEQLPGFGADAAGGFVPSALTATVTVPAKTRTRRVRR